MYDNVCKFLAESLVIEAIKDTRILSNLAASTAVLSGLVLNKDVIKRILRSDIMRESVIYQDILQEGLEQGIQQNTQEIAIKLINKGISLEIIADATGLTIEQLQKLQAQTEDIQPQ
ncbi:Rpn family recombination-promoting nuclease/putative transposase [Nostoc spongiaeforme FACHB-130]|uniref:Rpn family recombination-promoting nuclease/putative transposase n=1 Tax=Nostoc spongiaeforme FACHB-130 TaxID=1357510 RepID=A0ABR8FV65_9NOSO|nr:Rpn family recombination-promoting nuclease/putative transposase [Nostoc spongiaeforme]MBD2595268.1 Rpn family recombination-promoting nuclease/putative transposase [Nostoc spongiaeforme FACHB-130]